MKLLSTSEASRALKISIDAVQRLVLSGKLPAHKVNNKWRISKRDIAARLKWKAAR